MSRVIIVSNRLPVTIEKRSGTISYKSSAGGLATGLASLAAERSGVWIGWPGITSARLAGEERDQVSGRLEEEHSAIPVFLSEADVRDFYHGFANRTLWPLFHYFLQSVEFDSRLWRAYERVNQKYAAAVLEHVQPDDVIWIHDYQLMLLPGLIRDALPDASIAFFLHVPFPSYEVFRALPWRRETLSGLLGADLVGFHTYDYVRSFLVSCQHLLGVEEQDGQLLPDHRRVLVDAFPMGIDFDRYAEGAGHPRALREAKLAKTLTRNGKIILSVDRLDYTKGIPQRLAAFQDFLERYPEWRGRVTMICVSVPSRTRVEEYRRLKEHVERLVGAINGRWSTLDWTPVRYLYRTLPFLALSGLYAAADVALVTPLRDGMNLVAKEYVAARTDGDGVLVLSEMAGAAKELLDAVLVDPYAHDLMVETLRTALEMPIEEQRERMTAMRRRVARYDIVRWGEDLLGKLDEIKQIQSALVSRSLRASDRERLVEEYEKASGRALILDYDGTLMPFSVEPASTAPDEELLDLLGTLASVPGNEVAVVSGRDGTTLERWLGDLPIALVAEHGARIRPADADWFLVEPVSTDWKDRIRPVLELYADRTPGAFVEEKAFSLVWHYRRATPEIAKRRLAELEEALTGLLLDRNLVAVRGNRVLEIKSVDISKGKAAHRFSTTEGVDFVLVMGDDRTDEDMFAAVPTAAWTVKVGSGPTEARFSIASPAEARVLLRQLVEVSAG